MQFVCLWLLKAKFRVRSVTIQGTKYAIGYVLVCYIEEDDMPVFGSIKDIIIKQNINDTLFILQPYRVSTFNTHYYSYEVRISS